MIKNTLEFDKSKKLNTAAYKYLFNIENKLRVHIIKTLNHQDSDWWSKLKQRDFQKLAAQLKDDDMGFISFGKIQNRIGDEIKVESKHFIVMHEIFYTNISDLYLIIKEYWDFFKNDISSSDEKEIFYRLKIARRIRNKVMHSKPITSDELEDIKSFSSFIDANIISYKNIDECLLIKDIYDQLHNEIFSHLEKMNNALPTILKTQYYDLIKNENFWNTDFIISNKNEIDNYYLLINELNELIIKWKNTQKNKHLINVFINENRLISVCQDLIYELDKKDNEPI